MSTPFPPPRLQIAFAAEAPIAVIIRRGPSKWSQLILWETDTDTFMLGQWLIGRVVWPRLSPNGQHLAMNIMSGKSRTGTWEDTQYFLVSRPPYFTALAIAFGNWWSDRGKLEMRADNECPYPSFESFGIKENPWEDMRTHCRAKRGLWISPQGRKLFAKDGVLYEEFEDANISLIDLNPYQPTQIETPDWARRW